MIISASRINFKKRKSLKVWKLEGWNPHSAPKIGGSNELFLHRNIRIRLQKRLFLYFRQSLYMLPAIKQQFALSLGYFFVGLGTRKFCKTIRFPIGSFTQTENFGNWVWLQKRGAECGLKAWKIIFVVGFVVLLFCYGWSALSPMGFALIRVRRA